MYGKVFGDWTILLKYSYAHKYVQELRFKLYWLFQNSKVTESILGKLKIRAIVCRVLHPPLAGWATRIMGKVAEINKQGMHRRSWARNLCSCIRNSIQDFFYCWLKPTANVFHRTALVKWTLEVLLHDRCCYVQQQMKRCRDSAFQ